MESSRPIAYLVTLRTCERRVRVSRLGHVRGERENQSRPLGHCDGLRAGGLGAQPQVVASRAGWWQAGALSPNTRLWSRHAITVYLWTVRSRDQAVHYVVHGQDVEPSAICRTKPERSLTVAVLYPAAHGR